MKTVARWVLCLGLAAGCVEQPSGRNNGGASQQQLESIRRQVVSRTAPTPQHRLDFNFDGKLRLLGYNLSGAENNTFQPGHRVTLTLFWQCVTPPGNGWRLFTHLDDATSPRTNMDSVGATRQAYQPELWRAGEFIRDEQTIELPADWNSPVVRLHVGVWKDGVPRMAVTPANQTDGDRRARVIELQTGVQPPPPPPVAELTVGRAAGPIAVDGNLNEAAWSNAARTMPFVNTMTGDPAGENDARGSARLLWDDTNLYIGFEVSDANLVDVSANRDDHLWEHDAVEVMIDPDGDGQNYFEFQVSPRNQRFDTRYDRARDPAPVGHADYNPETRSAVRANGTIGNADDNDTGYTVEFAIPWAALQPGLAHTPPQNGDTVRLNLYLMDEPKSGGVRAAAWSAPRRGDFHTLERFGRITLTAQAGGPAPAPAAPTPAAEIPAIPPPGQPVPGAAVLPPGVREQLLRAAQRPAPAAH
ncbi:MAG: carbohydrate-binding family 9-like protein [Myxococcales bacterium]|nr:carbohydrate-binding family 9-like protein [Myxococcales bacterium]